MVKTKQTPRKSDSKGKLPPLAPRRRQEGWGTAAETFHQRFQLPQDPQRWDVSYKGMSNRSKRINSRVYFVLYFTVLLYCILMSNKSYSYPFIYSGMQGKGPGKGKRYYKPPTGGRRSRLGTQALREIWQAMLSTNLCIPRLPFLWYVDG